MLKKSSAIFCILFAYAVAANLSRKPTRLQAWSVCGNTEDYVPTTPLSGGNMCVGGGDIPTEAAKWFLRKANGGDAVMIIPSALNTKVTEKTFDYAKEWCTFNDAKINSVYAINMNSDEISYMPEVLEKIRNAEAVYFTGGDQRNFWIFIKDTPLQSLLHDLISTKNVAIGGSSAGCAIQGEYLFNAEALGPTESLVASEALVDPWTRKITIGENFLNIAEFRNIITDTHYVERNRVGRLIVFMARVYNDAKSKSIKGVGIDRDVAVCVEKDGKACVYNDIGSSSFFLSVNDENSKPEVLETGKPFTWNNNGKAIKSHEVVGTKNGEQCFDLNQWDFINNGKLSYYSIINGVVYNIA